MKKAKIIVFIMAAVPFIAAYVFADTVYLKNGGSVEGIIDREDQNKVEVNMGFGTVTFYRSQVKNIERSSTEDSYNMAKKWDAKRKELQAEAKEFEEARNKRFKDSYEDWAQEHNRKMGEEGSKKDIQIKRDQTTKSIVVEALLNDKLKANLVVDTGASLLILSRKMGEKLGVDLTDTKNDAVGLRLADGRMSRAKTITLDSVRIQDVEVKNVMAAVILEQAPDPYLRDGLLGMSFLSRFNLKMDLKNMKMTFENIEK